MSGTCMSEKAAKITLYVSIAFLICSVVLLILFPTIYKNQLSRDITLTEGSIVTKIWQDIPLPIYEKIYFFNITNREDFLKNEAPLNVSEVGPYVYKGKWVKKHPHWHSNGTVSYKEKRTFHFVPEMSHGSEYDEVYTLNGPMATAGNILSKYSIWYRVFLSIALGFTNETLIIKKSIRELVYEGYDDVIIKYAPMIRSDIPFKDGRFAWLYGKNGTNDGIFTVSTGADNASRTGILDNWNGNSKLTFWKGDTCNMINGTNIETGPPIKGDQETYTFFQSIFCRSLTFKYTGDETHYGIVSKRFQPTYNLFANGSENPDNYCFDIKPGRASGVLDVSPCQFGSPVLISFPHFHLADPSYFHSINGLEPNGTDYGSHLDVEPITGISIHAEVKFQINLEIQHVKGIFQLSNVKEGIFPILWVDLSLTIDEDLANFLKRSMDNPKIIAYSVLGITIAVCVILIIVSIVMLRKAKDNDDELLIKVEDDDEPPLWTERNTHTAKVDNSASRFHRSNSYGESQGNDEERNNDLNNKTLKTSNVVHSGTESSELKAGRSEDDVAILQMDKPSPKS